MKLLKIPKRGGRFRRIVVPSKEERSALRMLYQNTLLTRYPAHLNGCPYLDTLGRPPKLDPTYEKEVGIYEATLAPYPNLPPGEEEKYRTVNANPRSHRTARRLEARSRIDDLEARRRVWYSNKKNWLAIVAGSRDSVTGEVPPDSKKIIKAYERFQRNLQEFEARKRKVEAEYEAKGSKNAMSLCTCPSHGFVQQRNAVTNALEHVGYPVTVSIDLLDFFDSISYDLHLKSVLTDSLANRILVNGHPAQGLPTSPHVSNLATMKMDANVPVAIKREIDSTKKSVLANMKKKMSGEQVTDRDRMQRELSIKALDRDFEFVYTRYVDDLSVSIRSKGDPEGYVPRPIICAVIKALKVAVKQVQFNLNESKTRVQFSSSGGREICGVLVHNSPRDSGVTYLGKKNRVEKNARSGYIRAPKRMRYKLRRLQFTFNRLVYLAELPANKIRIEKSRVHGLMQWCKMKNPLDLAARLAREQKSTKHKFEHMKEIVLKYFSSASLKKYLNYGIRPKLFERRGFVGRWTLTDAEINALFTPRPDTSSGASDPITGNTIEITTDPRLIMMGSTAFTKDWSRYGYLRTHDGNSRNPGGSSSGSCMELMTGGFSRGWWYWMNHTGAAMAFVHANPEHRAFGEYRRIRDSGDPEALREFMRNETRRHLDSISGSPVRSPYLLFETGRGDFLVPRMCARALLLMGTDGKPYYNRFFGNMEMMYLLLRWFESKGWTDVKEYVQTAAHPDRPRLFPYQDGTGSPRAPGHPESMEIHGANVFDGYCPMEDTYRYLSSGTRITPYFDNDVASATDRFMSKWYAMIPTGRSGVGNDLFVGPMPQSPKNLPEPGVETLEGASKYVGPCARCSRRLMDSDEIHRIGGSVFCVRCADEVRVCSHCGEWVDVSDSDYYIEDDGNYYHQDCWEDM